MQVVSAKVAAARAGRDLVLRTGRYLGQVLGHKVGSTVHYSTISRYMHYNITLQHYTSQVDMVASIASCVNTEIRRFILNIF